VLKIRKFKETDLEFSELARIDNLVNHDSIDHPDDDKRDWYLRDKNLVRDRFLLYDNESIVGAIYYNQGRKENCRTTFFTMNIDPKFNLEESRLLLYNAMKREVDKFHCNKIYTNVYEHSNYDLVRNFLISKGFKHVQTNREYSCKIKNIDLKKYQPLIKKLKLFGVDFYDSKEEMQDWPNHYKKLEELTWTYHQDFPIPNGVKHTRTPFQQAIKIQKDFEKNYYGTEIVAVKDGKYIGSTDLEVYYKSEPHKAWTNGLGVLKDYRRKGIATALKIKAIEKLIEKGITEIRTDNEENNPMYKINLSLGFEAVPFSLDYMKEI
tara:strand:+ start:791 stop:1756 length:966 start_codon:yes stop_codon:yes gene_type:complete